MDGPSPNLTWKELAASDGTPYPEKWRKSRAVKLARAFECVRHECGDKPLRITSGFRTPETNTAAGGKKQSQHLEGLALDLAPPKGLTTQEFFNIIKGLAKDTCSSIKGIGLYTHHVHIDVRDSERLIVWKGSYGNTT